MGGLIIVKRVIVQSLNNPKILIPVKLQYGARFPASPNNFFHNKSHNFKLHLLLVGHKQYTESIKSIKKSLHTNLSPQEAKKIGTIS